MKFLSIRANIRDSTWIGENRGSYCWFEDTVNYRIVNDWNRGDIDLCRLLLIMFPEISQSFGDRVILILYFDTNIVNKIAFHSFFLYFGIIILNIYIYTK